MGRRGSDAPRRNFFISRRNVAQDTLVRTTTGESGGWPCGGQASRPHVAGKRTAALKYSVDDHIRKLLACPLSDQAKSPSSLHKGAQPDEPHPVPRPR